MGSGLTCVDLFAGAGGFSLGFENADFEILAATDYHEMAQKTYEHNLRHPFLGIDISELSSDVNPLLDAGGFDSEDVEIVIGGPPCKGFSTAGVYDSGDPRNSLFDHYIRVVDQLQPQAIVLENVVGAKSIAGGKYVNDLLSTTRKMGFNTRMLELNAADYGVPQLRERLFFIGYRGNHSVSRPPQTHAGDTGQQRLGYTTIEANYVNVKAAISDLDFLRPGESATVYQNPPQSAYQRAMRRNHDSPLHNHVAPNHSKIVRERFATISEGGTMDDLPPRLQTDKHTMMKFDRHSPANTITTLPEDFVHYRRNRIPTVRELARLQSFPDSFEFKGPRTTGGNQRVESLPQYSQVGNAVPPLLAEAVARHLKSTLQNKDPIEAAKRRVNRFLSEEDEPCG
jgi:DNA (cytosine-5)-methyltransferase 1